MKHLNVVKAADSSLAKYSMYLKRYNQHSTDLPFET